MMDLRKIATDAQARPDTRQSYPDYIVEIADIGAELRRIRMREDELNARLDEIEVARRAAGGEADLGFRQVVDLRHHVAQIGQRRA